MNSRVDVVVVGSSLGGLTACQVLFSELDERCEVFFCLVQHRHPRSGNLLCPLLQAKTRLIVTEAEDKMVPQRGGLYVAPPGYHLLTCPDYLALSADPAVGFARPSIDVLFESAADSYQGRVLAVMLTGSNADGAHGAARIKQMGGYLLVQDPKCAESPEGPTATLQQTNADAVLPLTEMAGEIRRYCSAG